MDNKNLELFASAPVPKAVLANAIPAIISMLMALAYNLADTFFIGQTHDPYQVAAVSYATPVFFLFMSFGVLLGVGGTSLISRSLGAGRYEYAKGISSFCFWASCLVGLLSAFAIWLLSGSICSIIGTTADTFDLTKSYLNIVAVSAPFMVVAGAFSNIIRAEGKAMVAMTGMLLGNIINIVLDPIMILGLGWGVNGAALATVIGNVAGALYYIIYFLRKKSALSISPADFKLGDRILTGVLAIGLPASLSNLLMSISAIFSNKFIAAYGDLAVAGIGVAVKVTMIVTMLMMGIGQGIQPILGFCFGAKNKKRFFEVMRFSIIFASIMSVILSVLCFIGAEPIVRAFIDDAEVIEYGALFAKIMLSACPLIGAQFVLLNAIQGIGAARTSLVLSVCRQGIIYLPLLIIINTLMHDVNWLVAVQPIADLLSFILSIILFTAAGRTLWAQNLAKTSFPQMPNSPGQEA